MIFYFLSSVVGENQINGRGAPVSFFFFFFFFFFSFLKSFFSFNFQKKNRHHLEHIMEATKLYTSYHKSYDDLRFFFSFQFFNHSFRTHRLFFFSFKPSTYKGDIPLAFIPTNLHHQKMKVYPRVQLPFTYSGLFTSFELTESVVLIYFLFDISLIHDLEDRLGLMNGKVESTKTKGTEVEGHEGEYHITTFGAPAAHTMKFKSGGLRFLLFPPLDSLVCFVIKLPTHFSQTCRRKVFGKKKASYQLLEGEGQ